jgi:TPR repeat protein
LFWHAAEQGFAPAMANLGRMYVDARGVNRDDVRGYALIRAALQVGIPLAMNEEANRSLAAATARLSAKHRVAENCEVAERRISRGGLITDCFVRNRAPCVIQR